MAARSSALKPSGSDLALLVDISGFLSSSGARRDAFRHEARRVPTVALLDSCSIAVRRATSL
jgi:hypothetical protein